MSVDLVGLRVSHPRLTSDAIRHFNEYQALSGRDPTMGSLTAERGFGKPTASCTPATEVISNDMIIDSMPSKLLDENSNAVSPDVDTEGHLKSAFPSAACLRS